MEDKNEFPSFMVHPINSLDEAKENGSFVENIYEQDNNDRRHDEIKLKTANGEKKIYVVSFCNFNVSEESGVAKILSLYNLKFCENALNYLLGLTAQVSWHKFFDLGLEGKFIVAMEPDYPESVVTDLDTSFRNKYPVAVVIPDYTSHYFNRAENALTLASGPRGFYYGQYCVLAEEC
jgi:hypothetical protein